MRLFMSPTSPYARKVRMVVREKGLAVEDVAVSAPIAASPVAAINPLGKVPALQTADGRAIYDSRVIVQYLEGLRPEPAMVPSNFEDRIETLRWEALADGASDAAVAWMLEGRRAVPDPAQRANQLKKVESALAVAQDALAGRRFLVADRLTVADLALVAACGYAGFRGVIDLSEGRWTRLSSWLAEMHERPSVAATVPQ